MLAAVSPAVVTPHGAAYGRKVWNKTVHSANDYGGGHRVMIFLSLFCLQPFLGMAQGAKISLLRFVNVPVSIFLGILLGAVIGYVLYRFFLKRHINIKIT